jgi:hypothetical protein
MRQRPLLARSHATPDVVSSLGVAIAMGGTVLRRIVPGVLVLGVLVLGVLVLGVLVPGAGPSVARAQEPAHPPEILDPFASPVVATRRATPELLDPFPARLPATRSRAVVRSASELLDPFVGGAVSAVSELLDPWAP